MLNMNLNLTMILILNMIDEVKTREQALWGTLFGTHRENKVMAFKKCRKACAFPAKSVQNATKNRHF